MQVSSEHKAIPITADIIVKDLISGITKIKADLIIGMYLTGSIPLNDFHPNKSDIDLLILCKEFPERNLQQKIKQVHNSIDRKFKKTNLNGYYITPDGLNFHNVQTTKTLSFEEGRIHESAFEMAPTTLYELKTVAITVCGIPAHHLPVVIEQKDVNDFLLNNINSYWNNWVNKHASASQKKILLVLIPRLTEWVILGVARQLYTLKTGNITSKTGAGYYCLEHLPKKYHPVLLKAIKIRNDDCKHFLSIKTSYYVQPSIKRSVETIECARYIIRLFNDEYNKSEK
ncbi:MAG: aminoglycoside adenylyltransferase domain-containing protein [Chitinophagaceae bacterium]